MKKLGLKGVIVIGIFLIYGLMMYRITLIPNALSIEVVSPAHEDVYQVFYDIGGGFNERDSLRTTIYPDEGTVAIQWFGIPFDRLKALRIDPGTRSGERIIKSIQVCHRFHKLGFSIPLYTWKGNLFINDFSPAKHIGSFGLYNKLIRFEVLDNDPSLVYHSEWDQIVATVSKRGAMLKFFVSLFVVISTSFLISIVIKFRKYANRPGNPIQVQAQKRPKQKMPVTNMLHILCLWGFAVTQPLYDILAQYPEFFVAHGTQPANIFLGIFLMSFGIPAMLVFIEWLITFLHGFVGKIFHFFLLWGLTVLTCLPALKRFQDVPTSVVVAVAVCIGGLLVVSYAYCSFIRQLLTYASISIIVFPMMFIFFSPVQKILFAKSQSSSSEFNLQMDKHVNIVMVLFDEIASQHLMNGEQDIDSARFPNFAKLAGSSYWFRNAVTVADGTERAVPAILTGLNPPPGKSKLPSIIDYPNNLFTLLKNSHKLNVIEPVTKLAPDNLDGQSSQQTYQNKSFFLDSLVVYLHLIAPKNFSERLPDITQHWKNFAGKVDFPVDIQTSSVFEGDWVIYAQKALREDRIEIFRDFIDSITNTEEPALHFLDIGLPHPQLEYLPSTKTYGAYPMEGFVKSSWSSDQWAVAIAFQRYLAQLMAVDTLVGELLDRLIEIGIYDSSLLIIAADHGVSFRPDTPRRAVKENNFGDIVPIPLFMKLPYQKEPVISDKFVRTIDILPTIADILGIQVPWNIDGVTAFEERGSEIPEVTVTSFGKGSYTFKKSEVINAKVESLHWMLELVGSETLLPKWGKIGYYKDLIGKKVDQDIMVESTKIPTISIQLDQTPYFDTIDVEHDSFLPCYITGKIISEDNTNLPSLHLALTINDTIWAVTQLFASDKKSFAFFVPEEAFVQGKNSVDVFVIKDVSGDKKYHLVHTDNIAYNTYVLQEQQIVDRTTQEIFPILSAEKIKGYIDGFMKQGQQMAMSGWAVDVEHLRPVEMIMIFVGDESVYFDAPNLVRADVVTFFNKEEVGKSGFKYSLPLHIFHNAREVRFFAISEGVASELTYSTAIQGKLQQFNVADGGES